MFRAKICGVRTPADARAAVDAGADAIGLNFYEKSPRSVTEANAAAVREAIGPALAVGVFVNAPPERIAELAEKLKLDAVQLHGDEPAGFVAELPEGLPVIRAVRMDAGGLGPAIEQLAAAERLGRPYAALLVDAAGASGEYGGTGRTADWRLVAQQRPRAAPTPVILAGGLRPENVAEAVHATGVAGVDTASGVESAPGIKDASAVREFVAAALAALGG